MKPRDHIASVSCLLAVVIFLLIEGAAIAQEFMPPPAFGPGAPSLVYGRFYVQGGVQYRNIQRFGFRRFVRPYSFVQDWGQAPFGTDQEGPFGTGTGVVGYPTTPDGINADPNISGNWIYDNSGFITPNGVIYDDAGGTVVATPVNGAWDSFAGGLGQRPGTMTSGASHYQFIGEFQIGNTPDNVQDGFSIGASSTGLNFTDTTKVSFRRVLNSSVNGYGTGRESLIWTTMGPEIRDREFTLNPICPTLEFGFQWTNFFDLFGAFSWYDMDINFGGTYHLTSSLSHRAIKDTFPYTSSRTGTWQNTVPSNTTHPSTLIETVEGVWDVIFPDSSRNGVSPNRTFFFVQDFGAPPAPTTETIALHTDVRIYEYKLGARSWIPLYGLGRFGVVFGPLVNQINYNASLSRNTTVEIPNAPAVTIPYYEHHNGTLWSFGLFTGTDMEVAFGQYFGKFGLYYNLTEEKVLKNADNKGVSEYDYASGSKHGSRHEPKS